MFVRKGGEKSEVVRRGGTYPHSARRRLKKIINEPDTVYFYNGIKKTPLQSNQWCSSPCTCTLQAQYLCHTIKWYDCTFVIPFVWNPVLVIPFPVIPFLDFPCSFFQYRPKGAGILKLSVIPVIPFVSDSELVIPFAVIPFLDRQKILCKRYFSLTNIWKTITLNRNNPEHFVANLDLTACIYFS